MWGNPGIRAPEGEGFMLQAPSSVSRIWGASAISFRKPTFGSNRDGLSSLRTKPRQ
jgi:hypothetical protein